MTERRRFFPAVPTQQVPGRTVELQLQLRAQPVVVAPAPADDGGGGGGGEGIGPALLIEPWDFLAQRDFFNRTYDDWRVIAGDVEINPELPQPFRAVYVGGSSEIDWNWTLDTSTMGAGEGVDWFWGGVTVDVQDGTALITVDFGYAPPDTFRYSTLVLTPNLNGTPLTPATLRIAFNLGAE
jgi:hypothetical protein